MSYEVASTLGAGQGAVPAAFRDVLDLGENTLDILQIRLAAPVQAHTTIHR